MCAPVRGDTVEVVLSPASPGLPVSAHSVLDLVPQLAGQSAAAALRETVEVSQVADDLGYRRFWLGEHHGIRGVGSAVPAVLAGILAARTDRIRLGAGGVQLPLHQPLLVAEQFAALSAAYPSRIDLALAGQSPVSAPIAAALGSSELARDNLPRRLDELCGYLRDGLPGRAPVGDIRLSLAGMPPPVFVVADNPVLATVAAARGLPLVLAHHQCPVDTLIAAEAYRTQYRAFGTTDRPYLIVTAGIVTGDSDEEALIRLAEYVRVKGRLAAAAPRATTADLVALLEPPLTNRERRRAERLLDDPGHIVGSRVTAVTELANLASSTGADEIMLVPLAFDGLLRSAILRTVAGGLTRSVRSVTRHFVATA